MRRATCSICHFISSSELFHIHLRVHTFFFFFFFCFFTTDVINVWVIKAGLTFQVRFSTYQCTSNSLNSVCCPPPLWLVLVLLNHPETESGLIPSFAQQLRQTPLASTARAILSSELSPSPHLLPVVIVPVCFTGGRLWGLYNSHPSTAPELATGQPAGKQHGRPRGEDADGDKV